MKGILLLLTIFFITEGKHFDATEIFFQDNGKTKAYGVLQKKCNTCHATKKRTDIFTLENMDSLATNIHEQVFVKKKMPKGRKAKLTEEESKSLQEWLDKTLDIQN